MKNILIFCVTCFLFTFQGIEAASPVTLRMQGTPTPYTEVTFYAESSFVDLSNAQTEWEIDSVTINQGVGKTKLVTKIGGQGESMEVIFRAITKTGIIQEKLFIIPGTIDLLWEAETATPPFFKGKAIPTDKSTIYAMAIPYWDAQIPQSDITFKWKKDGKESISKTKEKNYIQTLAPWEGKKMILHTQASFSGQDLTKEVSIESQKIRTQLYRISPLRGIDFRSELSSTFTNDATSLSLFSFPFGMQYTDYNKGRILFTWGANGKPLESGVGKKFERITISRPENNTKGSITITNEIQNTVNVMQYGEKEIQWNN